MAFPPHPSLTAMDGVSTPKRMNDMTEKLIEDGSEGRRAKRMMVAAWAGAILVLCGVALFLIKGATVEYVDAQGILHENFWMIGVGWILILLGVLVTVSTWQ